MPQLNAKSYSIVLAMHRMSTVNNCLFLTCNHSASVYGSMAGIQEKALQEKIPERIP